MENFITYKRYRWAWWNGALLVLMSLLYILVEPPGGNNGGTTLGTIYGVIAVLGILYLMWFGARKRSYSARFTTLKGCLSAHAWIGVSLLVIVPLHSGFQFGVNIHTWAYLLMVMVVVSGIVGALRYIVFAREIESNRGGGSVDRLLEQIELLNGEIDRTTADKSDAFLVFMREIDVSSPKDIHSLWRAQFTPLNAEVLAPKLKQLPAAEANTALQLIGLITKKIELLIQVQREVRVRSKLQSWLYLHLPLSFALVLLVGLHIYYVLYYR